MVQPKILYLSEAAPECVQSQIQHFLNGLSEATSAGEVLIVFPEAPQRDADALLYDHFRSKSFTTRLPTDHFASIIEYNRLTSKLIREWKPSIVVASHAYSLPGIFRNADRDFQFIYYMVDNLSEQVSAIGSWAIELNAHAFERASIVVSDERRKLKADIKTLRQQPRRYVEMLNVGICETTSVLPAADRINTIYAPGINGPLLDSVSRGARSHFKDSEEDDTVSVERIPGDSIYCSLGTSLGDYRAKLARIQRHAFSLVRSIPLDTNQLFSSQRVLFDSLAAATPVICAPHPQCVEIVDHYDCGIIMKDWTEDAIRSAVKEAIDIFERQPQRFLDLCQNSVDAADADLNWKAQFERFLSAWN